MMKNNRRYITILMLMGLSGVLAGCGVLGGKDKVNKQPVVSIGTLKLPDSREPVVQRQGAERCGNEPEYTLNGQRYQVLPSAVGYREEGVASWYGAEYQGSDTAGCEVFDMHAFTAAHRTLPLPSFARVTNVQNGKSVIVRVNDRGPFDHNGVAQLSFAAASTLGMTGNKLAKVRVEGLDANSAGVAAMPTKTVSKSSATRTQSRRAVKKPSPAQQAAINRARQSGKSFFIVIRNYAEQSEALEMFVRLTSVGLNKTEMASAKQDGRNMHQVRIGPLYTQDQIDNVSETLESNGLATFRVVEIKQ